MLSVWNANLSKDTPVKTDASQKNSEYGRIQDIIAPPDLMHEGITSDVPICGEKTNILFHPTLSVSYEPTFARWEHQADAVCIVVFAAIIILGRTFGGKFIALIPLAMCLTSDI